MPLWLEKAPYRKGCPQEMYYITTHPQCDESVRIHCPCEDRRSLKTHRWQNVAPVTSNGAPWDLLKHTFCLGEHSSTQPLLLNRKASLLTHSGKESYMTFKLCLFDPLAVSQQPLLLATSWHGLLSTSHSLFHIILCSDLCRGDNRH